MKKRIRFVSNRYWLTLESQSKPTTASKVLPNWYKNANRYYLDSNGKPIIGEDSGKLLTWKSCPALYDTFTSGYVYKTPCDIEFFLDENGIISAKVLDKQFSDFIQHRVPMPEFVVPMGYHETHFAWWSEWAVELPDGYSALYTQPFNHFELPFLTTSGIIDNDKVSLPGTLPFFISKEWTGILPAGTPYAQIFPFKRENWQSEIKIEDHKTIYEKNISNAAKYRKPNGGVYQKEVWERRIYT